MRARLDEILAAVDDPDVVRAGLDQLAAGLAASAAAAKAAKAESAAPASA